VHPSLLSLALEALGNRMQKGGEDKRLQCGKRKKAELTLLDFYSLHQ
jgi:hypothetical protein